MYPPGIKKFVDLYFWLCWVFIAVHRLSLVVVREGYSPVVCGLLIALVEHRL